MSSLVLILVPIFCAVVAIKLPGPCPTSFPIQDLQSLNWRNPKIIYRIPRSSESKSYLFVEMTKTSLNTYLRRTLLVNGSYLLIEDGSHIAAEYRVSAMVIKQPTDFTLISTIGNNTENQLQCFKPVHESASIWVDSGYLIIWSCLDSKNKKMRDEGLIVGRESSTVLKPQNETLKLRLILTKYVSYELLHMIDLTFPGNLWNDTINSVGPFYCPFLLDNKSPNIWILLAILIVVLGFISIIWYCSLVDEE